MKKPPPPRPKTKKKKPLPAVKAKLKLVAAEKKKPTTLERIGTLLRRVTGTAKKPGKSK